MQPAVNLPEQGNHYARETVSEKVVPHPIPSRTAMLPQAQGWTLLRWTLVLSTFAAAPASAQSADRIWGRVHTTEGEVHRGFIRWDETAASWADILEARRELPEENYFAWLEAHDRERATRTIELRGYRIIWDEVDPDFPMEVLSGVRFGHLDSLVVLDGEHAQLTLRSGTRLRLEPRGGSRGTSSPDVHVEAPGETEVEVEWEELERVVFSTPPATALPAARRLYGDAEDRDGHRFTGYLAWDQDEILESDVLDGRETRRPSDRQVRFDRIRSLARTDRGTRVELRDGGTLELEGSNDVDRGNRGLRISDPGLGVVVVPWEHLQAVRLDDAGDPVGEVGGPDAGTGGTSGARGGFDGGRLLAGTVVTREGEEVRGELRWDADEAGSWDILNGETEGIEYGIEFGFIRRIVPGEEDGAAVTLADGRTLELDGPRDVSSDNKGVMVAVAGNSGTSDGSSGWRLIPWDDIREVRFDAGSAAPGNSGGA